MNSPSEFDTVAARFEAIRADSDRTPDALVPRSIMRAIAELKRQRSPLSLDYWTSVYIGLTRVAISQVGSHLIVVNGEPRLENFLSDWFEPI